MLELPCPDFLLWLSLLKLSSHIARLWDFCFGHLNLSFYSDSEKWIIILLGMSLTIPQAQNTTRSTHRSLFSKQADILSSNSASQAYLRIITPCYRHRLPEYQVLTPGARRGLAGLGWGLRVFLKRVVDSSHHQANLKINFLEHGLLE